MIDPVLQELIDSQNQDTGLHVTNLPVGTKLAVQTRNTLYEFEVRPDGLYVTGGVFFPDWTLAHFSGSTWGGSMLKLKWIGLGMHMEFANVNIPPDKRRYGEAVGTITTTEVRSIKVAKPEVPAEV